MRAAPIYALTTLALAGCSTPEPARRALVTTGLATNAPEPQEFVRSSRPAETAFRPVGVTPAPREVKARDKKGVEALRQELETRREAVRAGASALPPPRP